VGPVLSQLKAEPVEPVEMVGMGSLTAVLLKAVVEEEAAEAPAVAVVISYSHMMN
jgi:hypothetical protein